MTSSGISSFLGYCFIFGILVALMTYLVISSPTSPEPQATAVVSQGKLLHATVIFSFRFSFILVYQLNTKSY